MHLVLAMPHRDIVVIGASAGGLQALIELIAPLPLDVPAAVFIVVHTAPDGVGLFPAILERSAGWQVAYAQDQQAIEHRRVYVAPPDHHLLVKRGNVRVVRGPRENRFRPAVDPLFRTASRAYGPRVIGVVLSGGLDDGTHGLELIKRHGGLAIAQDPAEAILPSMPLSAIQNVEVDYVLGAGAIGARLPLLIREQVGEEWSIIPEGTDVAEGTSDNLTTGHIPGPPSPFTCPECGGALWELEDGKLLRFRCHVGHGFTADSLLVQQDDELEHTLWSALRALEEQAALRRRMALHAEHVGRLTSAREFSEEAKEAERRASALRRVLTRESVQRVREMPKTTAANGRRSTRAKRRRNTA